MNKIKCYQIAPENQTSPIDYDFEFYDWDIFIFGNRHLRGKNADLIEDLKDKMYEAADELKRLIRGNCGSYNDFIDIIDDLLPAPNHKKTYSRVDRLEWKKLLLAYDCGAVRGDNAAQAALEIINGKKYEYAQICGCCQSEWNNIIYPAEYGREWLKNFEIEYFNTGAEWRIDDGSGDDYYFYSHEWSDDGIRKEIADAAGAEPKNVILYEFAGYTKTPEYREVI